MPPWPSWLIIRYCCLSKELVTSRFDPAVSTSFAAVCDVNVADCNTLPHVRQYFASARFVDLHLAQSRVGEIGLSPFPLPFLTCKRSEMDCTICPQLKQYFTSLRLDPPQVLQ